MVCFLCWRWWRGINGALQMGVLGWRSDFLFWLGREMVRNADNIEDMIGPVCVGGQYARGFGGTVETQRSPRARSVICGCWGSGSTDTATKRYVWGTYPGAAAHTRPWASTGFRERRIGRVLGRAAASLNHDAETELYYVRNRTYNPVLGRWIQSDPIGYRSRINLYEFVYDNPVRYLDPKGLQSPAIALEEAIAAGGPEDSGISDLPSEGELSFVMARDLLIFQG